MHSRQRIFLALVTSSVALIAIAAVAFAWLMWPYWHVRDYLPVLERNCGPVVVAIDRYESANGCPPERLKDLVPVYIAEIPRSGFPRYQNFRYRRFYKGNGSWSWSLSVECDPIPRLSPAAFFFSSSDRVWKLLDSY